MLQLSRRQILQTAAAVAAALPLGQLRAENMPKSKIITFTKYLQPLNFDELADAVADLGFDGVEAPIRVGGHIEPKNVADELPKFVEALKSRGLTLEILTSSINSVDSPNAEETLKVAKSLGIPQYRMAYYRYDLKKPVLPQLADAAAKLKDLVALNAEVGIQAVYQNHSGNRYVGAPIWDIYNVIREYDAQHISMAFDIGHARVEGGLCWPIQWNLVQSHLGAIYVKDYQRTNEKPKWCSVTEGTTPDEFFKLLAAAKYGGPISLHVEYLHGNDRENARRNVAAMKSDLAWLQGKLKR